MVLAYSRKMYLEFTLAETMEHFLSCHQHAFEYFGGVTDQVWVDNCKVAVLSRAADSIVFNPRYLDFSNHYGFQIRACGVKKPHEKGRVENAVGYVKKNFLEGLELSDYKIVNPAARHWLETVANVRVHGQTQKKPDELFAQEKLKPLHPLAYESSVLEEIRVNSQFRFKVDGNAYSAPCHYASSKLALKKFADRLLVYNGVNLVAEHIRSYDRNQDYELPDHVQPLLLERKKARNQKLFFWLSRPGPKNITSNSSNGASTPAITSRKSWPRLKFMEVRRWPGPSRMPSPIKPFPANTLSTSCNTAKTRPANRGRSI